MQKASLTSINYQGMVACFLVGIACWLTFSVWSRGGNSSRYTTVDKDFDADVPQEGFEPSDVVTLQVRSLQASVEDTTKLRVCYSLASPENRSHTGPFSRFSSMVRLPPYDRLAQCVDWQLGGTVVDKNFAAVLVSTVSRDGEICGFRFVLQRQKCNNKVCWMTEGVEHLVEKTIDLERQITTGSGIAIE